MRLFVYPYSSASESAKLLAAAIDAKRIRLTNSEYEYREDDIIVNWGNTRCPYPSLNPAEALQHTVNKLSCFRMLRERGFKDIPEYWTDPADIPSSAFPVFCRERLEGCDGAGIVVADTRADLVPAKLYTKRISGAEYRVTIFQGEVTDIQTKAPRYGVPLLSSDIKTYANGWGFQRLSVPGYLKEILSDLATDALMTSGLDFAGMDIIYDATEERAYLLEINSAMGLEGGALDRFAEAVLAYKARQEASVPCPPPATQPVPEPTEDPSAGILEAVHRGDWQAVAMMALQRLSK